MRQELVCEVCREIIGIFHEEDVVDPITGAMFLSKDPQHGYPPPFRSPGLTWVDMRCPWCRRRPMLSRTVLLTNNGYWSITEKKLVARPEAETATLDRSDVEAFLQERDVREEMLRHEVDAKRLSEVDHRLAEPNAMQTEKDAVGKDIERVDQQAGDQPSEPDVEVLDVTEMTPEQREEEAKRRIQIDEMAEKKAGFLFPCPHEDCDKGYKHSASLRRHLTDHHEVTGGEHGGLNVHIGNETGVAQGAVSTGE